ncbi:MAG: bifunctional folylpolyglutamate synthase/dihydrofolate synthase, partial [Leptospiraceae bacterium]|nr:bifunctional folylpolyglutamate synthase/dihydrofolate synthase [Leptospiraceae bacterium]
MEILAQEFLSKLRNFEKQRNRNLFQNYSLDFLEKVFQKLGLESSSQAIRVSVVGTNGKGSTAFFLSELILKNQLGTVGLYTSPHLLTERERIQVNGNCFEYEDLNSFLQDQEPEILKDLSQLSYFEFLTLFAMFHFRKQNCNFEIYEA